MRDASDVSIGADGETAAMACHPSRVDVPGTRLVHESAFRAPHRQARDLGREAVERAREVAVIPHAYDDEHPRCLELVGHAAFKAGIAASVCRPQQPATSHSQVRYEDAFWPSPKPVLFAA